jgi:selenocysteine lyase/cysteine desulfurase
MSPSKPTLSIDDYAARFDDEPGYLDFAARAPMGLTAAAEQLAMTEILVRSRFGSLDLFAEQDQRVREAVAAVTGFTPGNIVFQPNTSMGLMHAMFGLTGTLALSLAEFPSMTVSAVRSGEALHALKTQWIATDDGRVTPGNLKKQLTKSVTAVGVSLVDFRTGYLVDLEGIRQVIGDRLLIVDAIQGFSVVDAPFGVADIVVSGGQKYARAGWGTGFLALSDRALERLTPVFSGFNATEIEGMPLDEVPPPASGARAYSVSNPDPIAQARFAAALEEIHEVGVSTIHERVIDATGRIIDLADEFGIPVVSSRNLNERAAIVVVEPAADQLTVLAASLHNHGVTATRRGGTVRLSAHVSTTDETFDMLRAAFLGFASAITV